MKDKKKIGLYVLATMGGFATLVIIVGLVMFSVHFFNHGRHHSRYHEYGAMKHGAMKHGAMKHGAMRRGAKIDVLGLVASCSTNSKIKALASKRHAGMAHRLEFNAQQREAHDAFGKKLESAVQDAKLCENLSVSRASKATPQWLLQRGKTMRVMGELYINLAEDFEQFYQQLDAKQQTKLDRMMRKATGRPRKHS